MSDAPVAVPAAAAAVKAPQDDEEYQRKRAEVMRKVAEARAAQAAAAAAAESAKAADAEAPEAKKFGTHTGITCDGCAVQPIQGYRWRCRICKNHDLCDACYEVFKASGEAVVACARNPAEHTDSCTLRTFNTIVVENYAWGQGG
jgi:hypothetical protein